MAERKDRKTVYRIINQYIDALRQRNIRVAGSYLFGSYATDNTLELSGINADIEPHPFLIDEFNENNPMAAEILRTGEKVNL